MPRRAAPTGVEGAPVIPASMVRLAMGVLCLVLLAIWMAGNIADPTGGSVNLGALAGGLLVGAALILEAWRRRSLVIRPWAAPLLLFLAWFVIRWVVDVGDPASIKAVTVATTGGVLLYLLLGVVAGVAIESLAGASGSSPRMLRAGIAAWIAMLTLLATWMLVQMWVLRGSESGGRLVLDTQGRYQRPGNLLILMVAVASCGTIAFLRPATRRRLVPAMSMVVLTLLIALSAALFAQFFGSNMAAVAALGIAVTTVAAVAAGPVWARRRAVFEAMTRGLVGSVFAIGLLLAVGALALATFSIEFDRLRITGYGSGAIRSVESRLELWENFPRHFADSPVLGNMAVDAETTGRGTYVHGVFGMLLTHTGVIGFVLFGTAVVSAACWLLRRPIRPAPFDRPSIERAESLHAATMLIAIVGLAGLGTAITWAPMWFVLGLTAPPVAFAAPREIHLSPAGAEAAS